MPATPDPDPAGPADPAEPVRQPGAGAAIASVLTAGALFGTAGTAAAFAPAEASATAVGLLRLTVGAVALLVALPMLGGSPRRMTRLLRTPAMLASAAGAAAYQPLFFGGVARAGVALGTLVAVGSAPVLAGLVGWAHLGLRPTRGWLVATSLCLLGLVLLSAPGLRSGGSPAGLLLALGAGGAIACYNVAAKVQLARGVSVLEVPAGSFLLGGVVLVPLLVAQPLAWLAAPGSVAIVLYLGLVTMGLANVLFARAVHGLTPGPVTTLMLADPVVATALGVVVLGERLAPPAVLGVALLLGGLLLQGALAASPTGAR